ncbi:MAG: alcohol dehydrogenase catalytic domain-containing protein [Nocardioidaceae bacterium]
MHAVVIKGPSEVAVEQRADPSPGSDEVLLEVSLTGICGTDIHILDGEFGTATYPLVPGHEVTGRVVAVGGEVARPEVGDRVVVDPALPCKACWFCRSGRANLCERRHALGVTQPGGAAELVAVPAGNCYVLDGKVDDAAGVLCEPLACVIHAFDLVPRGSVREVLIYGAGPVGLLAVHVARQLGARSVDTVDINEGRLGNATQAGARAVATSGDQLDQGGGWDLVVDASGAPPAIEDGLSRVRRGGTFLQIGVAPEEARVPLSPYQLFSREITLVGSMTTSHTFPRAIELMESGVVDAEAIVGPRLPLDRYHEAVAAVRAGDHLKVLLKPGG